MYSNNIIYFSLSCLKILIIAIKMIYKNINKEFSNNILKEIIINEHNLPNNNLFLKNIIQK